MGSGISRDLEDGSRRRRSKGLRVLSSSCIGLPFALSDEQTRERRSKGFASTDEPAKMLGLENHESCGEVTVHQSTKTTSLVKTTIAQKREALCFTRQDDLGCSSSRVQSLVDQSSNHSGCLHCPFSFISERTSFRKYIARVLRSSGNSVPSGYDGSLGNRAGILENIMPENSHHDDRSNASIETGTNEYSHRNVPENDDSEIIHRSRRHGPQVPLEGSMRFSRTLSVGRLRDRVLRRNTLSEGLFGALLLEERLLIRSNSQVFSRQTLDSTSTFTGTNEALQSSSVDSSTGSSQLHATQTSQVRGTSNHNLLERRSAFFERRRRIRSQVRALQQLGSRFENLSRHDRSCILSGQHRIGRCTCRLSNRPSINNDTSSRSSISRIVMLTEALFQVLDEIHQQSAALSSRQSISSVGSAPAPKEVVDGIPMKVHDKSKKYLNQEVPQCYICLVEYEDGDFIRTLPCQHEFHQTCIDKWLKEIHRVCPVCRGNVCK